MDNKYLMSLKHAPFEVRLGLREKRDWGILNEFILFETISQKRFNSGLKYDN